MLDGVMSTPDEGTRETFRAAMDTMVATGHLPWELMADDFVWDMSNVAWPERNEYVGRAGVGEFMTDWISQWEDWSTEPIEFIEVGHQMVLVSVQTGRAKGSGVPVEMTYAQIWSRNAEGLATRARMFESREEALRVARAEAAAFSRTRD